MPERVTGELRPAVDRASANGVAHRPLVFGRRQNHRLDLRLVCEDAGRVEGRALLLGVFRDVRPAGGVATIDRRMGGVIGEIIERRMYAASLGEVFVLPVPRRGLGCELVVLVGLGNFGEFNGEALRFAVENVIRTLLRCQIDEIVTVPIGGRTGLDRASAVRALLLGTLAALRDCGSRPSLRGLTLCEIDPEAWGEVRGAVIGLATSQELDELDLTLEVQPPSPQQRAEVREAVAAVATGEQTYLVLRQTGQAGGDAQRLDCSLLTPGKKATVLQADILIDSREMKRLIDEIVAQTDLFPGERAARSKALQRLDELGRTAAKKLLPEPVVAALQELRPAQLSLVTDAPSSLFPWEVLRIGEWRAAIDGNLSRRYVASGISVAKWLQSRREERILNFLLIVNPTSDLEGAEAEGKRIEALVGGNSRMELVTLRNGEATKERITAELRSGRHDVLHYAGHAGFDPANRSASGLLCAGGDVLSGRDLASLQSLPSLAVFNACETARTRAARRKGGRKSRRREETTPADAISRNVSFAEAFLRGGIGSYVGTWWPVGDSSADLFARTFYETLLGPAGSADDGAHHNSVGAALLAARKKLSAAGEIDWADYIHYGEPDFRLKTGTQQP